jgi:hypothetical protein
MACVGMYNAISITVVHVDESALVDKYVRVVLVWFRAGQD